MKARVEVDRITITTTTRAAAALLAPSATSGWQISPRMSPSHAGDSPSDAYY